MTSKFIQSIEALQTVSPELAVYLQNALQAHTNGDSISEALELTSKQRKVERNAILKNAFGLCDKSFKKFTDEIIRFEKITVTRNDVKKSDLPEIQQLLQNAAMLDSIPNNRQLFDLLHS